MDDRMHAKGDGAPHDRYSTKCLRCSTLRQLETVRTDSGDVQVPRLIARGSPFVNPNSTSLACGPSISSSKMRTFSGLMSCERIPCRACAWPLRLRRQGIWNNTNTGRGWARMGLEDISELAYLLKIFAFSESIPHNSDTLRFCISFRRGTGAVEVVWPI